MKIMQIRNATILILVMVDGKEHGILIDPMLADKGAIPPLKYATMSRRRNPLVELPSNMDDLMTSVTCCLITHCQKGHFDHLDRAATKWLRERKIPVYCSTQDVGQQQLAYSRCFCPKSRSIKSLGRCSLPRRRPRASCSLTLSRTLNLNCAE